MEKSVKNITHKNYNSRKFSVLIFKFKKKSNNLLG